MINNRQNGRRRGRGGPQVRNGSGNSPERGNRIDNRARGNAAQLHEKYRNLARDAQTQGDRVMTEYYLQFADHYFRVLSEGRARFEEQNPNQAQQRRPHQNDDFDEGFEGEPGDEGSDAEMAPRRFDRDPRRETGYDDGDQPIRQNGGDAGYNREVQNRDVQNRDGQNRDSQNRDSQQQGRDYRDGQQGRGNRDPQYGRDNRGDGRTDGRSDNRNEGRNGQQARDNRPAAADRGEQQRPPREPYPPRETHQPREDAPVEGVNPPSAAEAEAPRPRRGRPPRNAAPVAANGDGGEGAGKAQIEVDRLPPAFALEASEPAAAPRTRRKSANAAAPETEIRAVEGEPTEPAPRRRRVRRDPSDDSNVAA